MKRFLNARETIVHEAIDGLLSSSAGRDLARLDGYPHIKVVVRKEWDKRKVAVVSGGGAGHEPAHAGFVGRGMLAGAICGDIFASPSVDAVLACILAVTGEPGCLLVVKNYTGDRLNFGLAAEKAKRLGYRVEMVVVSDDVALPDAERPRGIAGTLFVHKVAGHLAEAGSELRTVAAAAEEAASAVHSLGVSLSTCTIPGQRPQSRLGEGEAELGLGIHGEPGAAVIEPRSVEHLVDLMVEKLSARLPSGSTRLAVLINNLGTVPPMEMGVIANQVASSRLGPQIELVFGPATMMTSLDMNGFSLSLLELTDGRREALLSPVGPLAWAPGVTLEPKTILPLPDVARAARFQGSPDDRTAAIVRHVCDVLVEHETELNALDAQVGDGDTGTTFANAARSVLDELIASALPLQHPDQLCLAVGELLGKTVLLHCRRYCDGTFAELVRRLRARDRRGIAVRRRADGRPHHARRSRAGGRRAGPKQHRRGGDGGPARRRRDGCDEEGSRRPRIVRARGESSRSERSGSHRRRSRIPRCRRCGADAGHRA